MSGNSGEMSGQYGQRDEKNGMPNVLSKQSKSKKILSYLVEKQNLRELGLIFLLGHIPPSSLSFQ